MKTIVFTFPGNEHFTGPVISAVNGERGEFTLHHFPDGESYVRVLNEVRGKDIVIICSLNAPDTKILSLYFLSRLLRESGAGHITLVAPYLAYMRQDKQFNPGEAVTSGYFASFLSMAIDKLITIDPHLHRHSDLSEIYPVPCRVIHSAGLVFNWITANVVNPVIVGPDSESTQWVKDVAGKAGIPFLIMEKIRTGDHEVDVKGKGIDDFKNHTPVLVDDIISTAQTMIGTIKQLRASGLKMPVCIGIHGIFAGNAFRDLLKAGASQIVTTNSIRDETNRIDVTELVAEALINE